MMSATVSGQEQIRLYAARLGAAEAGATPGSVLAVGDDGVRVAVGTGADAGTIPVGRIRVGKEKLSAGAAAKIGGGSVLGDGRVS